MLDSTRLRKAAAGWAIIHGLIAAILPGIAARLVKRLLGFSFENTAGLHPKPGYIRQIRAAGVGLLAAGTAGYILERMADSDTDEIERMDRQ